VRFSVDIEPSFCFDGERTFHAHPFPGGFMPTTLTAPRSRSAAVFRRRRVVAGSLVTGVLSLTGLVVADVLGPGDVPASAAGTRTLGPRRTVVAHPGDSLWSLAEAEYRRSQPDVSFSDYVDALVDLNDGTLIEVGQRVLLP
jgi:hypothetical protein